MKRAEIERLAYGYELMHRAICHMAGTSGADGRWYMQKAQEVFRRVDPVWEITATSNAHKPGDCLTGYRSFLASADRSGEADETLGGSAEGESAVPAEEQGDAPNSPYSPHQG